jgi:hypothetical protein
MILVLTSTKDWLIAYMLVNSRVEAVGKGTVMPSSFIGGPRDMRHRYMDTLALVRRFSKLDIFLTMTCNPN